MTFVDGQEYTSKNGKKGTWNAQTGCFHVVNDGVSTKYTAADFGLEEVEVVQVFSNTEE